MTSQVYSTTRTIATAVSNIIKALISLNLLIGTNGFCIGLAHDITCNHSLPLNISKFIPTGVERVISLTEIQPLNNALAKVTAANIRDALINGVVLAFVVRAPVVTGHVIQPYAY